MAASDTQTSAGSVWRLAARQHGVATRDQLLALGFNLAGIRHRIATGRLHPLWEGVFAVGRPDVGRRGYLLAAVLTCGETAALSHQSSAELWGMRNRTAGPIDVSVRTSTDSRRAEIRVHRRTTLTAKDVVLLDGIPVTTPACTLVDLATRLPLDAVERAVNEADRLDLIDPDSLRRAVERMRRRPGAPALSKLLDRRTFSLTDSELERRFLPLARRAGLPKPATAARVDGFKVDFYWADLGLVVETDGLRYHRTPAQQARDQTRDQTHAAAGLTPLRFTRAQVRFEPDRVERTLRAVATRLAATHGRLESPVALRP